MKTLADIKTFNYFICSYLINYIINDPDDYIKKELSSEIKDFKTPELVALNSTIDGIYMRFKFWDGKAYEIKINEYRGEL